MLGPGSVLNNSSAVQTENKSFSLVLLHLDGEPWEGDKGKKTSRENRTKAGKRQASAVLLFVTIFEGFVSPRACNSKVWETQGN